MYGDSVCVCDSVCFIVCVTVFMTICVAVRHRESAIPHLWFPGMVSPCPSTPPHWFPGNFTAWERMTVRYAGASAMYFIGKRLKKRHHITDERASLYGAAETWVDALAGRPFLGEA